MVIIWLVMFLSAISFGVVLVGCVFIGGFGVVLVRYASANAPYDVWVRCLGKMVG